MYTGTVALGWGLLVAGVVVYLSSSFGRTRRYGKRRAPLWKDPEAPWWEIATTLAGIALILVGSQHASRDVSWEAPCFGAMGFVVIGHFAVILLHNRRVASLSSGSE